MTFRNNTNPSNNSIHFPQNNTYLNDLLQQVRHSIPPPTNIPQNDAEIMAAVLETYNSPQDMKAVLKLIYEPQNVTPEEANIERRLLTQGLRKAIGRVSQATLPEALKQKILNRIRYSLASHKIHHMFEKEYTINSRYVHPEWNAPS